MNEYIYNDCLNQIKAQAILYLKYTEKEIQLSKRENYINSIATITGLELDVVSVTVFRYIQSLRESEESRYEYSSFKQTKAK
jgi:hypothetical protein